MARYRLPRSTVYSIKKLYEEKGVYTKRENGGRSRCGRQMDVTLARIKEQFEVNPLLSLRKLTLEMTMSL